MTTENIIGLVILLQVQIILIAWLIGYKRKYHRGYTGRAGDQGEKGDTGPKGIDYKKEDTGIREDNFIGYEKNKPTGLRANKEDNWVVKRIGNNEGNQVEYLVIVNTRLKREWTRNKDKATLLDRAKTKTIVWDMSVTKGYAYSVETSDYKKEEE